MDAYAPCFSRAGYTHCDWKCQIGLPEQFFLQQISWRITQCLLPTTSFPGDTTPHSAMAYPRTRAAPANYLHFKRNPQAFVVLSCMKVLVKWNYPDTLFTGDFSMTVGSSVILECCFHNSYQN